MIRLSAILGANCFTRVVPSPSQRPAHVQSSTRQDLARGEWSRTSATCKFISIAIVAMLFVVGCTELQPSSPQGFVSSKAETDPESAYDVVVVGAGSGGIAAAIQAARSGATVALLEETDWIGGQMTSAGVSSMDGPFWPQSTTGIYAEFVEHIHDYYERRVDYAPKSIGTCYFRDSRICFEPSVGQLVLQEMLEQADVHLFLRTRVTGVIEARSTVTGVRLAGGEQVDCQVLIDATEYGDVIPLTSARYRVGNSLSDNIDLTACIQDITYTTAIRDYGDDMPEELLIGREPPGYQEVRERFQTFVTAEGSGGGSGGSAQRPWSWNHHNAYRGMPDSTNPQSYNGTQHSQITRTGVNFANDFPGSVVEQRGGSFEHVWLGQLSLDYLEDLDVRRQVNCEAKLLTIQFLYYVQHEMGQSHWSVANDEGYDTPYNREENNCANIPAWLSPIERHMPIMPYVRESRRIVPLQTLTAADIQRDPVTRRALYNFDTAVALGDYAMDLHNCSTPSTLDAGDGPDDFQPHTSGVFQIPFEALIPELLDGFLAAEKNIGVSRLVSGATRLQPVTMLTGQAAGAIAALAVRSERQPRDLRPVDVQQELLVYGSGLSILPFDDVPPSSPYWPAVQLVNVHQLMNGYNAHHFGIHEDVSRAQLAVILARLLDLDTEHPPTSPSFDDLPSNHWAYDFVEAIYQEGLTSGCDRDELLFCPEGEVTRAQLAVFLARALDLGSPSLGTEQTFDDVPSGHWAFTQIHRIAEEGILLGCEPPERFCPAEVATRGQVAIALSRILLED